ncbi:MAG: hypothetical protein K9M82_05225 [Deltaproteobacteria bacterium]|nr:hypothetical protein [Deltaproteobacteria bacterium]
MVTNDEILSQDDVDALLAGADSGGDEPPVETAAAGEGHEPRRVTANVKRSDAEARDILARLCRSAFVPRDKGVRIIWNADGLFPLTPGYNMEIQGRMYVSLGPFGGTHLVVGRSD